MSESDPASASESSDTSSEKRNLPVPLAHGSPRHPEGEPSWLVRLLRGLFGRNAGSFHSALKDVLKDHSGETGLSARQRAMLGSILGLRERRMVDVMVPRADIVAVQQDVTLGELLKVFAHQGHSRLAVYDDTLDDAIGMVHIRDLIALMTTRAAEAADKTSIKRRKPIPAGLDLKAVDLSMPLRSARLIREILFVPPSMPVLDLLTKMQATRIHLALVVDEYGGTDGVVSMEDIVEEIVGEIGDEHDEDAAPDVIKQADGSFLADARARLEDLTAVIGPEFDVHEVANDVDTLAGYIASRIGRVPVRGELIPGPGRFEIEVLDADPRRVKKLKVSLNAFAPKGHGRNKGRPIGAETATGGADGQDNTAKLSADPPQHTVRRP